MKSLTLEENIAGIASRFINNTDKHVFLTGKAGTGKTTFLKNIVKQTYKKAVIVAPTGIAAINAGGITIHSLFQLPFGAFVPSNSQNPAFNENVKINTPSSIFQGYKMQSKKRRLLQELELLIIDEVSMLRSDLLDAIDTVLKSLRRNKNVSFGGVQVLFIGDLLQLPPVVKENEWHYLSSFYKTPFFFDALALKSDPPVYLELDKIYRQADEKFINILNNLRNGTVEEQDIEILNDHYKPDFKPGKNEKYIQLTTHNYKADKLNQEALHKLNGKKWVYEAKVKGDFSEYSYPVEFKLELKTGAQIMFIKNDPSGAQRFFNGKIGTVSSIDHDEIIVEFEDGSDPVELEKYTWENIKYTINESNNKIEEEVKGEFIHYPVKLAWAITVHKSQGLTFEKAIIDIGRAFAPGQVYVALSRLTSLDGLVLSTPINYNSLQIDKDILNYASTKPALHTIDNILKNESNHFFKKYILQGFDFSDLLYQLNRHINSYTKNEKKSAKQKYHKWAIDLKNDLLEKKIIADKFLKQLAQIFNSEDYKVQLKSRVLAAENHFVSVFNEFSAKLEKHLKLLKEDSKVKSYVTEIKELDAVFYKQQQLMHKAVAMVKTSIENQEFNSENIHTNEYDQIRELQNANVKTKTESKTEKKKKSRPKAGESKMISFELYKNGNSIDEIAKHRELAISTIEGHLAYYVEQSELNINDFVSSEKLKNILTLAEKINNNSLSELKQHLGDEYTYSDLRFAMAYNRQADNKQNH